MRVLLCALLFFCAAPAAAQEKTVSLSFTKELLYNIARDSQGEQRRDHIARLKGLSPSAVRVDIIRRGGQITLAYTVRVGRGIIVDFKLSLEKMAFYRLATAREDIDGMLAILGQAKEGEPLILDVAYRYDENYSIIDLTLDLRLALAARAREEKAEMEKAAAAFVPAPPAAPAPEKKAPPPPAKKKAPPKKVEPPKKKEPTYLSVRSLGRLSPPTIDGVASDPAWRNALPFSFGVKGDSGDFKVTLSALRGEERVYFLVEWPDRDESVDHRPWVWSEEGREYVVGKETEDSLAIQFPKEGRFRECMLSGREAVVDLWSWRAGRTNPAGFAEDGSLTISASRIPKANSYQAKNRKTLWIKEKRDAGTAPYLSQVAGAFEGRKVPRYVARQPSGSGGDVKARGVWKKGMWTVELSRKLDTGDPADKSFTERKDDYFSVAIFDKRERSEHSTSGEKYLRLE